MTAPAQPALPRLFVLGAPDPELEHIEALLLSQRLRVAYAQVGDRRVRPGERGTAPAAMLERTRQIVLVECDIDGIPEGAVVTRVDHHAPGDYGYGLPPDRYWEASSIGQVCNLVGVARNIERMLVAAADHCLGAAYRGECPGVSPERLRAWRVRSRAEFQRRPEADVERDIAYAEHTLRHADLAEFGGRHFADMRGPPVPELVEAASILSAPYVAGPFIGPDARTKYTASGAPCDIRAWLDWARSPAGGLVGCYGDPERGFAGGYLPCP